MSTRPVFSDVIRSLFTWAIVMLLPLLSLFLSKPAWAKVLTFIFLYPIILLYASEQAYFHISMPLIFTAALVSMSVAALLLINPTIKERVEDPSNSKTTGPAYYAGITALFLLLIFIGGVVPSSPFSFYPSASVPENVSQYNTL